MLGMRYLFINGGGLEVREQKRHPINQLECPYMNHLISIWIIYLEV